MIKKAIILIAISIVIVLFMSYAEQAIQQLLNAYEWTSQILTNVFSGGQAGNLARGLIALLCLPILIGLIPAFIYWVVKKNWFPYFMEVVWIVWLIQVGALLVAKIT